MKKYLAILLALIMTVSMAACGQSATPEASEPAEEAPAKEDVVQEEGIAPVGDPVTIIFGVQLAAETPYGWAAKDFAAEVEELSGGSIKVEVYTDSALGNESEMWEGIKMGTVDMMIVAPNQIANYVPEYALYGLPFLFSSYEHRDAVVNSAVADKMDQLLLTKGGMVTLGQLGGTGRYLLTAEDNPVTTMADAAGIKMRVEASQVVNQTWAAFGTLPVTVAYGEVYSALQTGVAEACENELSTFITQKWYENCPNLAKTQHQVNMRPLIIGEEKFNSLSPEQQQIIIECGERAGWAGTNYEREYEAKNFAVLEEQGVVINEITDKENWIAATEELRTAFCEQYGLVEIYNEIMSLA